MGHALRSVTRIAFAGAVALMICGSNSAAHHGPEEMIAKFTAKMNADGKTPVLLYKRATEYRILAAYEKASGDLLAAIELSPEFAGAWEMLAEIRMAQDRFKEAEQAAMKGIEVSAGRERAGCRMMLARVLRCAGREQEALNACNAAFEEFVGRDIDWYLIRGALQRRLGQHTERIADFQAGYEATRSTVLKIALLEARIEAGQAEDVLPEINRQLEASRLKSSWWLRRARALLALGKDSEAREDLGAAIAELNTRIRSKRPDVTLVADRGLAEALLGNKVAAERDLTLARKHGATDWMVELLVEKLRAL